MASQRKRNKRPKRRSRFAWLFKLLAVVTLLGAVTVGATVFFQVEQVEVVGNQHYTPEELVTASGILKGDNLFALRRNSIETAMEGELPYLETVEIDLKLPSGILITVEEWDAVATVETDTGNWLMSVGGKLLEQGEGDNILITGLEVLLPKAGTFLALAQEDQEKNDSLLELLNALEEGDALSLVDLIDMSSSTQITMTYQERFKVYLPLAGDYAYELLVLDAAIDNLGELDEGTLDLTQQGYEAAFTPRELE